MSKNVDTLSRQIIEKLALAQLPAKNCNQCAHNRDPQGGHCYMFKDEPSSQLCGAFRPTMQVLRQETGSK